MLKQFLSKLPRKSSRAQAIDPGKENCGDPSNSPGSGQALNGPRKTSSAVFSLQYKGVTQFIEKDPTLCSGVISLILKYWPITNSQKEVMIIGELEEILEGIHMTEFQEIMVPLFWRIGCCIRSSHFQVAERALFLWNNDQIVDLIVHNLDVILPIILPALESNVQSHWNHGVLNLTVNVRKMFLEMDDELFQACHSEYEEEQHQLNLVAEKREEAWKQLESAPGLQPIGGNIAVLVTTAPSR
ncbi:hypothetical protein Leryth_011785 [Lithospermum erythrorhizon]|nr:hypothetical protein Leryth_011785 [Lithospermum erythrorhizon]